VRKYRGAEIQRCFQAGAARLVQSGEERCREIQRCSIGVEMWRCRGVERCSGSAEVNHSHTCRGARAAKAKVQRRCRIEYMNMSKAGAEVQRGRGVEVQRGRGSERQRVREEMQRRSIGVVGVEMWRCRCAEVQRSREVQRGPERSREVQSGDAEMQHRCRDLEM